MVDISGETTRMRCLFAFGSTAGCQPGSGSSRVSYMVVGMHRGRHLLIDCREVPRSVCLDDQSMLDAMARAARRAGATVISQVRYRFGHDSEPGFTAMVLLDESHCSAHSYADLGQIAMDIFTCGKTSPAKILEFIREEIELGEISTSEVSRFREAPSPPPPSEAVDPLHEESSRP